MIGFRVFRCSSPSSLITAVPEATALYRIPGTASIHVMKPVLPETKQIAGRSFTICVPMDNDTLVSKMLPLLSREELEEILSDLPNLSTRWIENDLERTTEFKRILKTADRRSIFGVIKTIYRRDQELQSQNRHLRGSDQQIMKEAESILYYEIAQVLSIDPAEVLPYLVSRFDPQKTEEE